MKNKEQANMQRDEGIMVMLILLGVIIGSSLLFFVFNIKQNISAITITFLMAFLLLKMGKN